MEDEGNEAECVDDYNSCVIGSCMTYPIGAKKS